MGNKLLQVLTGLFAQQPIKLHPQGKYLIYSQSGEITIFKQEINIFLMHTAAQSYMWSPNLLIISIAARSYIVDSH